MPHTEQRTFFGHPVGLTVPAGTELWERFSFYGMQGLLRCCQSKRTLLKRGGMSV